MIEKIGQRWKFDNGTVILVFEITNLIPLKYIIVQIIRDDCDWNYYIGQEIIWNDCTSPNHFSGREFVHLKEQDKCQN